MIKQTLSVKQTQQLNMTPQLQQAIRLLQLSNLELRTKIQLAAESNPFLELEETGADEITLDDEETPIASSSISSAQEILERTPIVQTLQDYLLWQLPFCHFNDKDYLLAQVMIESVNDDGYLTIHKEDISPEADVVLKKLQQLDPPGIFARDLKECLHIQLQQLPDNPTTQCAKQLIQNLKQLPAIKRQSSFSHEALTLAIQLIKSLEPKPGRQWSHQTSLYVQPELIVKKIKGQWILQSNTVFIPKVRISADYTTLLENAPSTYLKDSLQEAKWFIRSIETRQQTLLKVGQAIMKRQIGFLEQGEEAMKPMTLNDIATETNVHESTVSRVTTQKYILTPRGMFELKYFFSSQVPTEDGSTCSSTAIRAFIKQAIIEENQHHPLSDLQLTKKMELMGIVVARRTIAKYRENLKIAPSHERKQ